jgi:hypothetical protein
MTQRTITYAFTATDLAGHQTTVAHDVVVETGTGGLGHSPLGTSPLGGV